MKIYKRPVVEQEYVLDTGEIIIQIVSINNILKVLLIIGLIVNAYYMGQAQATAYVEYFMDYRGNCKPHSNGLFVEWSCVFDLSSKDLNRSIINISTVGASAG